MSELNRDQVVSLVEAALDRIPDNTYGLRVKADAVYCVDGHWWVVLEAKTEPRHRSEIWDRLAEIEESLDQDNVKISLTAA